ncbi:hypothetical protein [Haloglomus irregulare]|uniref:hypothetical protein n=1 Tax=Haloglomus irregulare TaxID=2234134 RepID=UPI00118527E3|nr:hypothetical protein [Haloglomus irregulare]
MTDRPTSNRQGGGDSTRNPRFPSIDETDIQRALATRFGDGSSSETGSTADSPESDTQEDLGGINSDDPPSPEELSEVGGSSTPESESDGDGPRPYIKITPAREQVTPDHVIKGLYGLYRAGSGRTLPFHVERRLSFVSTHHSFEFLIHKPEATQRFDFYLGVRPYEVEAVEHLAANVRAMYPERFRFEIVPFATSAVFVDDAEPDRATLVDLESFEGLDELANLEGFDPGLLDGASDSDAPVPGPDDGDDPTPPAMVRWSGVETKNNDWMTLLSQFSEVSVDIEEAFRSPLSVLLEQATETDEPFLFQAVFTPRRDWTKEAETHKRNLKMGTTGMWSAFKQEAGAMLFGTSEEERRQRHRPDTPEQIGGTLSGGGDGPSTRHSRMGQIDLKQPTVTFDLSLRAGGESSVINGVTGAFTALSGPYYGVEGAAVDAVTREFEDLCEARLGRTGIRERFESANPIIVTSPDELANFVTVPNTGALPKASRGASGGSPDARSPLTATDEELLAKFDTGMCIGEAETATPDRPNIPISLTAEQLTHHVLRASTTGSGKTTAMVNDGLSAYEELDGPIFIFDKKGGSMATEYKRAHFRRFGDLDDVIHLPVPGPNGELPAFPFFDIRPQVAAGMSREAAVQEKVDRYNELLEYVLGEEQHNQAFVAQEILSNLIVALFDPVYGDDAFAISDLLKAATRMQTKQVTPTVSDSELHATLKRHFSGDERRFATSIDAVLNRITKLKERDFIWRMLNFVPEWDNDTRQYADEQMLLDLDRLLDSSKVILVDTGEFRPASSNVFTVLMLDYLWSWVRLRERWNRGVPAPDEGYCVNLIIDEAAPIMQASLVRDEMIPDAREFALAFELIVHFPEQVKRDALDTRAYKEILRNINTKLIGKLAIDDELASTLFHEELDAIELSNRIASLPRGEWLAQLPDTGFMTDTPELVTLKPLPIPSGHSDGEDPVDAGTYSPDAGMTYQEADELQWSRTRFSYCLVPGVNSPPDAAQRAARYGTGPLNSEAIRSESPSDSSTIPPTTNSSHSDRERSPNTTERDSVAGSTIPGDDSADSRDDSSNEDRADGQVGGASNEFGTVLGTGSAPRGPSPAPSDSTAGISDDSAVGPPSDDGRAAADASSESPPANGESYSLTPAEQQFLRDVIAGINGELEGYDLTQSMTTIRNGVDGEIDEDRLVEMGYLELQSVNTRKYYYVTPAGQDTVDRTIYSGRNDGDPFEKTVHKVYVEYTARHLRNQGLLVETYYEPMAGGMIFDVAAFLPGDDDGRTLAVIAEVVTNIRPDLMIKHYDDLASFDGVRKMWVVPHTDVAHEIIRVLVDAGRLQTVPHRDIENYARLSEQAFENPREWRFVGGRNLVRMVDRTDREVDR